MNGNSILQKITVLCCLFATFLYGQSTFDLRMVVERNDQTVNGIFDVLVQMKSSGGDFGLGSSNLVFNYNNGAVDFDSLLVAYNFSGIPYATMNTTEPVPGRVSVNIELFAPNSGTTLPDTFINVVSLRFRIVDLAQSPLMVWRTSPPNPIVVFQHDEATVVPAGNLEGLDIPLPVDEKQGNVIRDFQLFQNTPNPFNPVTTIRYALPKPAAIRLEIFNVSGQSISVPIDEFKTAGTYTLTFDGRSLPSGTYLYRLTSNTFRDERKMTLVK